MSSAVIRDWAAAHPTEKLLVWVSGGKDSAACLVLAVDALGCDRVVPVFRYLVDGLRCVETPIKAQLRMLRVTHPLVKVAGPDAIRLLQNGAYTWWQTKGTERAVNLSDVIEMAKRDLGCEWAASGEKRSDSLHRHLRFKASTGIDHNSKSLFPVVTWSHRQVMSFVAARRLPTAPGFGKSSQSGICMRENVLKELKAKYPDDFKTVCKAFPFAEAIIRRGPPDQASERAGAHAASEPADGGELQPEEDIP